MSQISLAASARDRLRGKPARYAMVSAVAVSVTQAVLVVAHSLLGWAGWEANVLAVSVGCIPSYSLNRYWVWNKRSPNQLWREVAPFWGLAVVGLAFSTLLVHVADRWWESTAAVSSANLVAFGSLWVVKYLILDQVLFGLGRANDRDVPAAA